MKNIVKNPEPRELVEWRRTLGADFNSMPKGLLRESLLREQGYICCYCMARIAADNCRIEHWQSRSTHPERQLDYRNLLLACNGGEGGDAGARHCDVSKSEKRLSLNPANPDHNVEAKLFYARDGRVSCPGDAIFDGEINEVLSLNHAFIRRNRAGIRQAVVNVLSKEKGTVTKSALQKQLDFWRKRDDGGGFKEYCQVAVQYLESKIAKRK